MTLNELLIQSYLWGDAHAELVLGISLGIPVVGTLLAFIGKGGKTDEDGRFIASTVMGVAMMAVLVELVGLFVARSLLGVGLLDVNVVLLAAPLLCLVGSALGIRLVFPLSELGSVRTVLDLLVFLAACAVTLWLLSKFRGWSVFFMGSFMQLVVVSVLGLFFLRRLYRRAFGLDRPRGPTERLSSRFE